jgi:cytochrome c556
MKRRPIQIAVLTLALLVFPAVLLAVHEHHGAMEPAAELDTGMTPLIEEMLRLDEAVMQIASAVAVGDGDRVVVALEPVHGTMEKTHEGVRGGTVKLSRNADRMEEFMAMDKAFHEEIEKLEKAARKNDVDTMLTQTKKMLDGCVGCHKMFR